MFDQRWQQLAKIIVQHSLEMQPNELLRIQGEAIAKPLLYALYREALHAGAMIIPRIIDPVFSEILFKEGNDAQLQFSPSTLTHEIETMSTWCDIYSEINTKQFNHIDQERQQLRSQAASSVQALFNAKAAQNHLRWCDVIYPTQAFAQDAGMSLWDFEDLVVKACLLDQPDPVKAWQTIYQQQQKITDFLNTCRTIRMQGPGVDLSYRCDDRIWINCAGKRNLPDGEVFTAPIEDSVNGRLSISHPSLYLGNLVSGIQLVIEAGKVTQASAEQGQDFLHTMLELDAGARFIGEVAFGLNPGITQPTGQTIFDEKMAGTMHLALGNAYPECGGTNQSTLHWDLVCDLHQAEVYANDELCYVNGKFII
ncbi:aminopeptidase [Herpetosiphon sp. NSE202]|uniref:aminopeptidase n=1 Tax=Herpetosiphon sp. NSE202 TaxID=3351349 RepID=UPI00362C5902